MNLPLRGKTILITGASMGIGRAVAHEFAKNGAHLLLTARSEDKLKSLRQDLHTEERRAQYYLCDFSMPDQVRALGDNLLKEQQLDGIVHNAGYGLYGKFESLSEAETRRLFEVNYFSILTLTQRLYPLLRKSSQGRIVMVSSVVSWRSIPQMSIYCASKAALNLFTETLRMELAEEDIKVTNIYPGRTSTDFSKNAPSTGWRPTIAQSQGVSPEYVAKKLVRAYLKGKRDEYVTFGNRLLIWGNFLFPKLIDWGLARYFKSR